ncbi:MAG: DUF6427 family protein [Bacteroidetes bacterium]|nr:DUF6427 family protein [Bacteroidota bacterium]
MLIRFFKNNNPSSFILLPLFALVLWIIGFFLAQNAAVTYHMPLYQTITKPLNNFHLIGTLIAFLLIISGAFLLNFIVNKYEILTKPSFLPALFYIVFMSMDIAMLTMHPFVFANIFIMLAIFKLVSSYQKDTAFSNAFDAGFLISLSTLFYFPSIVYIPILVIGFLLFRPFNWREWIISLLGIIGPYIFVFSYYFLNDTLDNWQNITAFFPDLPEQQKQVIPGSFYFMIGICVLILLFSFKKIFTGFYESSQRNKKGISLLVWLAVFASLSLFIAPQLYIQNFSALAIPASVFCANYFLKIKKQWWGELLFILLLSSIFIHHFFTLF